MLARQVLQGLQLPLCWPAQQAAAAAVSLWCALGASPPPTGSRGGRPPAFAAAAHNSSSCSSSSSSSSRCPLCSAQPSQQCSCGAAGAAAWRGMATQASAADWPDAAAGVPAAPASRRSSAGSSAHAQQGAPGQQPGGQQQQALSARAYMDSFKSPIKALDFPRGEVVYLPQLENNVLGRGLLYMLGAYSRKQALRNGAAVMFQALTEAAENTELQKALGLEPGTFMAPFNLLSLHMWLLINRLDQEPDSKDIQHFRNTLYHDHFYRDIERRVFAHGVQIRVGKWVDRLQKQFYGTCFAYDNALRTEGGITAQQQAFVAALLKNVYDGEAENRPWADLMARYLCRELQCLEKTDLETIFRGQVRFSTDIVVKP